EQVSILLVLLKVAREANEHSRDNIVDIAGYARVREMLDEEENKINDKISKDGLDIYRGVGPGRQLRVEGQLEQNKQGFYVGQTIPGGTAVQSDWQTINTSLDNPAGELVWTGVSGQADGFRGDIQSPGDDRGQPNVKVRNNAYGVPR
ncbi:MAG TPA: DUF6378 domain-containing protein, partial [Candidatus Angelobacter sp.]|nr:DUF6378 domain-containing protein [Candidatus Angelobacter sp.]